MTYSKSQFIEYCMKRHDDVVNQKYDGNLPYSKHLEYVLAFARRFKYLVDTYSLINWNEWDYVEMGCAGHDLIEDARVTYNDIAEMTDLKLADIIYCCTEDKSKNRDERHSQAYYNALALNELAIFVKLCDIMANATYSVLSNSSMYKKHKLEHEKTKRYLFVKRFEPMFEYLDKLFTLA